MAKLLLEVEPLPKDGEIPVWNAKLGKFVPSPFSTLAGDFVPRLKKAEEKIESQGKAISENSEKIKTVAEIARKGM